MQFRFKHLLVFTFTAVSFFQSSSSFGYSDNYKSLDFKRHEIETDFKITHPISVANLQSDGQQLVVIGEDKDLKRVLAIYEFQADDCELAKQFPRRLLQIDVPNHFLAYDIFQNGKNQKLVFQTNKDLQVLDLNKKSFVQLQSVESIYLRPEAQFLVKKKLVVDLNDDKKDDLFIPDFRGLHLLLQKDDGSFVQQTLPIAPRIQMNDSSATYNETRFFIADLNLDKKSDLVLAKDQSLQYFAQKEDGTFDTVAKTLKLDVNTSEFFWWELREADGQQVDQNNLAHRIVDKISDINNDGLADMLVRFSQSEGVLDRTNDYEIYLGKQVDGQLSFDKQPQSLIKADGTIGSLDLVDIDGDKKSEVLVSSFDIGVSQIIGALLSGSIDQDVYIFKMDDNGVYSKEPHVDKEVEMTFSLSSGKSGEPVVKLADFNGDGLKDLMFSSGESRLKIYPGTKQDRVFEKRSKRLKLDVPKEGKHVDTADIDNNGKEDVIVRYGRQDDKKLSNKFVVLMSQ